MHMLPSIYKTIHSERLHTILTLTLLFVLGTHVLDNKLYLLIPLLLLLIDWHKLTLKNSFLVAALVIAIYGMWIYILPWIFQYQNLTITIFSHAILMLFMFFLGRSISLGKSDKKVFYMLVMFFMGYMVSLVCSYLKPYLQETSEILLAIGNELFVIIQQAPTAASSLHGSAGMDVCFPNEYKRTHVNNGYLISTIIAYYLSFMAIILPFIVFNFKAMRERKFSYFEYILLLLFSLFALYLANEMGRRTVVVLLLLSFVVVLIFSILSLIKKNDLKRAILVVTIALAIVTGAYIFFHDTPAIQRLVAVGFHDKRFGWWSKGIETMLSYPFGGGHNVYITSYTKLVHNAWIDIGKAFGIIPFVLFVMTSLYFVYIMLLLLITPKVSVFLKQIILLFSLAFFAILMIEPVFGSDKTFFAFLLFFFGIISNIYDHRIQNEILE